MKIVTQLSIFMANQPGGLANICNLLSDNGINLVGFSVSDAVDHAVVRFIPDNPVKCKQILEESGINSVIQWFINQELKIETASNLRIAYLASLIGDKSTALDQLEILASKGKGYGLPYIKNRIEFRILENEPRYISLLEKINLADK